MEPVSSTTPPRLPTRLPWAALRHTLLAGVTLLAGFAPATAAAGGDVANAAATAPPRLEAERLLARGRYGEAVEAWTGLGYYPRAGEDLEAAIVLARASVDAAALAELRASLGTVWLLRGDTRRSRGELEASLEHARAAGSAALQARVWNALGNLYATTGEGGAQRSFARSHRLALQAGDPWLAATALLNRARAGGGETREVEARAWLDEALVLLHELPASGRKAWGLLAAARALLALDKGAAGPGATSVARANGLYQAAEAIAGEVDDPRGLSYALGYRGALYEGQHRHAEALLLTGQALFQAERAHVPEASYRWQWQLGRLYRRDGQPDRALLAYRGAVATVERLRREVLRAQGATPSGFRRDVEPVFLGLVDLLTERAAAESGEERAQALLHEARSVMERFKTAELEDYFRDDCVTALQARARSIDVVSTGAAAVYPIALPNRIELLVSLPGRMLRFTTVVPIERVRAQARRLAVLSRKRTAQYQRPAAELHDWLIAPMEDALRQAGVDTLVVIPGGVLRTIPYAALYDGERHLVEKFALAVAPGLTLLDPRPLEREGATLLLGGLTEGVQGAEPLPHVAAELATLHAMFGGSVFKDRDFVAPKVEAAFGARPYSLVHLASHAEVGADARASYLLTYDGRLTMDRLERLIKLGEFRTEAVELLTLSACQTAAGDERAALGLAGIAVKAGARSALATLWRVNDRAATILVSEFYRQLDAGSTSKAKALQHAQVAMLRGASHPFPFYWASFVMIGNWL
jgi:CHAT domain-containing protein